jgi:hypothetical protein
MNENRLMQLVRIVYVSAPYEQLPRDLFSLRAYGREFIVIQVLSRQFEMRRYRRKEWRQGSLI